MKTTKNLRAACDEYLAYLRKTRAKSPLTVIKYQMVLDGWCRSLGTIGLSRITLSDIREFASSRAENGASNSTINLDVIILGGMLNWFRLSDRLKSPIATANWCRLKHKTPRRDLMKLDVVDKLCAEALRFDEDGMAVYPAGQFMADYLRLLAYSGCRKTAALYARWDMVNWEARQISFHAKGGKVVTVDMNPKLEALLREMKSRAGDSEVLFPGNTFLTRVNPYPLFDAIKKAAGFPDLHLHDFRHAFISNCIMQGVDSQTVAVWVGHADGGCLINKVYCHLSNPHRVAMASRISL